MNHFVSKASKPMNRSAGLELDGNNFKNHVSHRIIDNFAWIINKIIKLVPVWFALSDKKPMTIIIRFLFYYPWKAVYKTIQ